MRLHSTEEAAALARTLMVSGRSPRIQVYAGPGASHSWVWLADALEGMGLLNARFVDADGLLHGESPDAVAISGGDAFRMADEIGAEGVGRIGRWASGGGLYMGICAGAYLGLASSSSPLRTIGLVRSAVANLAGEPPRNVAMPERYLVPCGKRYVYQAVRGPVQLDVLERSCTAPLLGGPIWRTGGDGQALARYHSWAPGATLLVEEEDARRALEGRVAAIFRPCDRGKAFLLGPHFEHPDHSEGHGFIGSILLEARSSDVRSLDPRPSPSPLIGLRRALADARVAYSGLEGASWTVGSKLWDQERLGLFVGAMWERLGRAEREGIALRVPDGLEDEVRACVRLIRGLRRDVRTGADTSGDAGMLADSLSSACATFCNAYFEARMRARTR